MKIGFWLAGCAVLVAIGTGLGLFRKSSMQPQNPPQQNEVSLQEGCPACGQKAHDSQLLYVAEEKQKKKRKKAKRSIASVNEEKDSLAQSPFEDASAAPEEAEQEPDLVDLLDGLGTNEKNSPSLTAQLKLDEARVLRGNERWDQALEIYNEIQKKYGRIKITKNETFAQRAAKEKRVTRCLKKQGLGDLAESREELVDSLVKGLKNRSSRNLARFASSCEFVIGEIARSNEVRSTPKDAAKFLAKNLDDLNLSSAVIFNDKVIFRSTTGRRTVEFTIDQVAGGWRWIGVKSNDRKFLSQLVSIN